MRSALAVCLILVYALTAWRIWFPIVHYEVQRAEYLARCENRLKPQLRCNGKCVLAKKLSQLSTSAPRESAPSAVAPMADCPAHIEPETVTVPIEPSGATLSGYAGGDALVSAVRQVAVPPPRG